MVNKFMVVHKMPYYLLIYYKVSFVAYLHSTKILLVLSKFEIFFGTLFNCFFLNIAPRIVITLLTIKKQSKTYRFRLLERNKAKAIGIAIVGRTITIKKRKKRSKIIIQK